MSDDERTAKSLVDGVLARMDPTEGPASTEQHKVLAMAAQTYATLALVEQFRALHDAMFPGHYNTEGL